MTGDWDPYQSYDLFYVTMRSYFTNTGRVNLNALLKVFSVASAQCLTVVVQQPLRCAKDVATSNLC